jgi:hypothetical protein
VSAARMKVRELAGWGFDDDEYRPEIYRGSPARALSLVTERPAFEAESSLVEVTDHGLLELLAKQQPRADLAAEMAGLDWSLGVVDLRCLLAFQRRIVFDPQAPIAPVPAIGDWDALVDLCFGKAGHVACHWVRSDGSIQLRSANPNLHLQITDDTSSPIAVHAGSPFFEVALYRGRWFLRDGYHRAFQCLQSGIVHLPAVIVRARTLEELGAVQPWFFSEEALFSRTPPRVADFLDDALVIEYDRSPLIKTLRITIEETYTLQGEEL